MSDTAETPPTSFWFYGLAAVCAFLVAATAAATLLPDTGAMARALNKLTLASENNAGAWWSGMLLAIVSLHAFDGHVLWRHSAPDAARGWAMLAAVLLFLSFDEVASVHERLGALGKALSIGSWSLLLPVGAVLAAVSLRAIGLLRRAPGQRAQVVWIVIGFGLLGTVALQEFVEHRIDWQAGAARTLRVTVEEGTELLGVLVLLRSAMANTAELAYRSVGIGRTAFAALHELRRPLVVVGLALAPALALATAALPDQGRGHPADWLAAVAFLAAGLVLCRPLLRGGRGVGRWATWLVAASCWLASVAAVAIPPLKAVELGPVEVSLRMVVLAALPILVGAAWGFAADDRGRRYAAGVALAGLLAAVLLPSPSLVLVYASSQFLGLAVYWANAAIVQQVEQSPAAPIHPCSAEGRRRPAPGSQRTTEGLHRSADGPGSQPEFHSDRHGLPGTCWSSIRWDEIAKVRSSSG